jgi:glycosyltransferase involved in cell wall biosynthesis
MEPPAPRLIYINSAVLPDRKASALQVMQMCAAFAAAGALVKLVARRGPKPADIFAFYGQSPTFSVELRPILRLPRSGDLFQARAALAEPGREWLCYSRGQDLTAPVTALLRGARSVVEAHGRPATTRQRLMLSWIARHPRGRLVVISEPLQSVYRQEYGLDAVVAPDGVDLARFEPALTPEAARQALGLEPGPWIVYVGGLYEGRGLEPLFQAAAGLPARLLIVGGRNEAEVARWRDRASALGAATARFEGYQPPGRVPLYLFAGDILAMPYGARTLTPSGEDTTAWMSPLKLYEYLAAGRPIVATDLPALRATLVPDTNALLARPDEAASLRAALERILVDPALAGRLAVAARQTAAGHTWQARAQKILELCWQ